ncbi:MAG: hypothetical protein COW30_16005 [Rhodospirillales bacterium CG15_BIG_FIL_POST_REV_8_21_14_020_66_15]|nr:MAG: hypothetical protein COW30_16005 [Rhodospirillales bacterium CG15_BIG_FIL_POST_REV_8_21_14_020_66_15]
MTRTVAAILFTMALSSCAAQVRGALHVDAPYEDVFAASVQAINDINYAVVRADAATGFIAAELGSITSSKTVVNMSVLVKRAGDGTDVDVAIVPRPGVWEIGRGTKDHYREFKDALKSRFPNSKTNF